MKLQTLQPRRIYQARLRAGLTQDDVAFRLRQRDVSASAQQIRRWERGSHAPRAAVIPALAEILGVSMDALYGDGDDEEEDEQVALLERAADALAAHRELDLAAALQRRISELREGQPS